MVRINRLLLACCLALAAASTVPCAAKSAAPSAVPHKNLLRNGGFEHWVKPTAQQKAAQDKGGPELPSGLVPAGWPYLGLSSYKPGNVRGGAVARDATVKHGGRYSLCIVNARRTDITDVNQPVACVPNTVYRLSCYIKGKGIVPNLRGGVGAIVWLNYGPSFKQNFWAHQKSLARTPKKCRGTFGWEKLSFTVNTGPKAAVLMVVVQLRRAKGTVWYDDVRLVREGALTHVKKY